MALILCPECKKEISSKASQCVYCGCPVTDEDRALNEALLTDQELLKLADKYFYSERKYKKAFDIYYKLAEQGNAAAQCEVGVLYSDSEAKSEISQNEEEAIKYLEKSAAQKFARAAFRLGSLYKEKGDGEKALYWYNRSIEDGYKYKEDALALIGAIYRKGIGGVKQNSDLGIQYYEQAASEGSGLAAYNLGYLYYTGTDVIKNENLARTYYELAAQNGYEPAKETLERAWGYSDEIECPNCGSAYVHKIGAISKGASALMWGVFSLGKVTKTYECKNCGYRW